MSIAADTTDLPSLAIQVQSGLSALYCDRGKNLEPDNGSLTNDTSSLMVDK